MNKQPASRAAEHPSALHYSLNVLVATCQAIRERLDALESRLDQFTAEVEQRLNDLERPK